VRESTRNIHVHTENYDVLINKTPYYFTILKNKRVVLQLDTLKSTYLQRNRNKQYASLVTGWQSQDNGVQLALDSQPAGAQVEVFFAFGPDNIQIELRTPQVINNELLGQNFSILSGEHWYGGNVTSAGHWPLESGSISLDPFYATQNQTSPVWLTSSGAGIFIDTYQLLGFHLNRKKDGLFTFHIPNTASLTYRIAIGNTIVDAYRTCITWLGKPQVVPPKEYFTDPIFNTWIEFFWDVNQKGLLSYAQSIRAQDFPASIIDIDDRWSTKYGDFDFDPVKFPDPKGLMTQLKDMKFKVALWVTPFIEPTAKNYRFALKKNYLIMEVNGKKPYLTKWWNGTAALIDLSNPEAYAWYLDELKALQRKYGVSGFKLDAGDAEFLTKPFRSYGNISANRYTDLFAELGKHFEVNELRVSWLTQRFGLVQRLRDKAPNWEKEEGLGYIGSSWHG
jgi:alpha-glucosidase (family GH31 glycosyl hydrolase)